VPPGSKRLLLAGYYGCGNAGDEAVLAGLLADLRRLDPQVDVVAASGDPSRTRAEHGVDAVDRQDLPALARALESSALVALSGGVLNDYWPVPLSAALGRDSGGLPFYAAHCALAAGAGVPAVLCGIGVGPLRTPEGRELTRAACALAAGTSVRDAGSLDELRAAGLDEAELRRVEVTADPAWSLEALPEEALPALLAANGLSVEDRPVGVALRAWDRDGARTEEWLDAVAAALDGSAELGDAPLLALSFDDADEELHHRLAARLRPGRRVLAPPVARHGPVALGALLGRCRVVLAMRYHGALLSAAAGVPVAALAYDPKVASLLADLGVPDLALRPGDWAASSIQAALERSPRDPRRPSMPAAIAELRARARRNAELLLATARSPAQPEPGRRLLGRILVDKALASWSLSDELVRSASEAARLREQESQLRERESRLREETSQLREQRSVLLAERADLERRLSEVLDTVGYRVLARFWALMRRAFPEGSRRRGLYRWARDLAAGVLGDAGATGPAYPRAREPSDAPSPADMRSQLAELADRAAVGPAGAVVAILSGTPLVESEGQRPTRLALALARRGIPVVFAYWRWDEHEWRPQDRLEAGILQLPLDVVARQPQAMLGAFPGLRRLLLLELPWRGAFAALAEANAAGWVTVYDALDDWAEFQRVGQAGWYDESFERHVIVACDAVFAVNEALAERVRALGGQGVAVLPNGVEPGMERVLEPRPLPRGEVTVGYFGYMAGAWFDWELIAEAARRRPAWRFYLIGYGAPEGVDLPANVTMLGRRPHGELAAFAASWDVGVVPFKAERLAAGADPIKTYEYLALGLPVVTTGVGAPAGAEELVARADSLEGFLGAIEAAAPTRASGEGARVAFARGCTWDRRVDALLSAVDQGAQRVGEKRALCGI
jgi:polysaccharide pyruvyl transferase CsaB